MQGALFACGLTAVIMLAAEAVKRYTKREEKETEKICETFAGRLEDIVARDAAEREKQLKPDSGRKYKRRNRKTCRFAAGCD